MTAAKPSRYGFHTCPPPRLEGANRLIVAKLEHHENGKGYTQYTIMQGDLMRIYRHHPGRRVPWTTWSRRDDPPDGAKK